MTSSQSSAAASDRRANREYWRQTCRPWPSLLFLLPLLVIYEGGVLWLGGSHAELLRSGADTWVRGLLGNLGFAAEWWPPLLIVLVLLGWHVAAKHPWRVSFDTLGGMFAESVLFAFGLVLLGQLQSRLFAAALAGAVQAFSESAITVAASVSPLDTLARVLAFVGAGIYEETIFRLLLLPAGTVLLRRTIASPRWAPACSALATSLLFAAAHHAGPLGEPFDVFRFCFRLFAGGVFAALFVLRGFGIAAGSHAIYDILVGVLLSE